MITSRLKSFDTFVIIATNSSSFPLSLTAFGLIAIPISSATACGLSIGDEVSYEVLISIYNKYKKQNEEDKQTLKSFEILYRNSLQDIVLDKKEYESLSTFFTKDLNETKNEFSL